MIGVTIQREEFDSCLEEFLALNREHWAEFNKREPQLSMHFLANCVLFTARQEGELVGYVVGFACEDPYYSDDVFFMIDMYFVRKTLRGNGVGGSLLDMIEGYAEVVGARTIAVSYNLKQPLEEFYRGRGFEPTHVVMRKGV